MPKISVIMPVYNTALYLPEAIESILSQSFTDFEFLIIDDGSTDGSYEICKSYALQDIRIKLSHNEKNMGISYTRNKLIELANSEYIAPQDSDDISLPHRLELSYEYLQSHLKTAVVSGDNIIIDEQGNTIGKRTYSNDIKNTILKKSPISQGSSMFRKEVFESLGGYDPALNYAEDYDLWLRVYQAGHDIYNLNSELYKVRIRTGQSKSDKLKQTIHNTLYAQERAIKSGLHPSISDRVYRFCLRGLLLFPSSFVLWLFTRLEYKK
ncbi:glycosyltransferase [Candidatus Gracilibacteria bacterium]|nr:glycosyltransferase [Candidatus Gracilibacteria bacterium]